MNLLIFPLLAFTPGIFWLWLFARRKVYRPGPRRLLIFTFLLGMAVTIPAGFIEYWFLDESLTSDSADLASVAVAMLFVVGPVEETCKFLAVRALAYRSMYFDEPADALVYCAAASLGFASLENLVYIASFGPAVMIGRAPLSTLGHLVFGSFWGYALSRQIRSGRRSRLRLLAGICLASLVHGLFNVSVFVLIPLAIGLVALGALWTAQRFGWARRVSPFRYRRNYPNMPCPNCHQNIRIVSRFCQFCGLPVSLPPARLVCGYCSNPNRPDARFCTRCGDQLLR